MRYLRFFNKKLLGTGTILAFGTGGLYLQNKEKTSKIYSLTELGQMCEKGRIVVAYKGSLYDMTDFTGHPGGVGRLQMAAGNDLAVYWNVYTQHNRGHIQEHMKPYKIGTKFTSHNFAKLQPDLTKFLPQPHEKSRL